MQYNDCAKKYYYCDKIFIKIKPNFNDERKFY